MKFLKMAVRVYCALVESASTVSAATLRSWDDTKLALEHTPWPGLSDALGSLEESDRARVMHYVAEMAPIFPSGDIFLFQEQDTAEDFVEAVVASGGMVETLSPMMIAAVGDKTDNIREMAQTRGGAIYSGPELADCFEEVDRDLLRSLIYDSGLSPDSVANVICEQLDGNTLTESVRERFHGHLERIKIFARPCSKIAGVDVRLVEGAIHLGLLPVSVIAYLTENYPTLRSLVEIDAASGVAAGNQGPTSGIGSGSAGTQSRGVPPDRGGVAKGQADTSGGGPAQSADGRQDGQIPPTELVPSYEEGGADGQIRLPDGTIVPREVIQQATAKILRNIATQLETGTEGGLPPTPSDDPTMQGIPGPVDVPVATPTEQGLGGNQKVPSEVPPPVPESVQRKDVTEVHGMRREYSQKAESIDGGGWENVSYKSPTSNLLDKAEEEPMDEEEEDAPEKRGTLKKVAKGMTSKGKYLKYGHSGGNKRYAKDLHIYGKNKKIYRDDKSTMKYIGSTDAKQYKRMRDKMGNLRRATPSKQHPWPGPPLHYDGPLVREGLVDEEEEDAPKKMEPLKKHSKNLSKPHSLSGRPALKAMGLYQTALSSGKKAAKKKLGYSKYSRLQKKMGDLKTAYTKESMAERVGSRSMKFSFGRNGRSMAMDFVNELPISYQQKVMLERDGSDDVVVSFTGESYGKESFRFLNGLSKRYGGLPYKRAGSCRTPVSEFPVLESLDEQEFPPEDAVPPVEGEVPVEAPVEAPIAEPSPEPELDFGDGEEAAAGTESFQSVAATVKEARRAIFELATGANGLLRLGSIAQSIGASGTSRYVNEARELAKASLQSLKSLAVLVQQAHAMYQSEAPQAAPPPAQEEEPVGEAPPEEAPPPPPEAPPPAEESVRRAIAMCINTDIPDRIVDGEAHKDIVEDIAYKCADLNLTKPQLWDIFDVLRKAEYVRESRLFNFSVSKYDLSLLQDVGSVLAERMREVRRCKATETEVLKAVDLLIECGGDGHSQLAGVLQSEIDDAIQRNSLATMA